MYRKLDEYIAYLSRNKSPNTICNYELQINKFFKWAEDRGSLIEPFEHDQDFYLDYIDYLKLNYDAPKTIHTHMTSVYGFINFLHRKGYISKMPFVDSKEMNEFLPVLQKKKVKSLSHSQLKNMLFVVQGDLVRESIIRLFYDTGFRVSELVNLKVSDIENDFGRIIVNTRGKGRGGMSKERTVRITDKTYQVVQELVRTRGFESEYVLTSPKTKKPLSPRRIDQIVKEIAYSVGIEDITTHMFRKSIATHLLENGMPIEYVSRYLGHASVATTINNYTDLDRSIHDKFDKFHASL